METDSKVSYYGEKRELSELRDGYNDLVVDFFAFYYADGSENKMIHNTAESYLLLPVRGVILALILLAAMTGAILLFKDIEAGFFDAVSLWRRRRLAYIYILIPTTIAGLTGLVGILFSGTSESLPMEIYNMVLYCFMVTGVIGIMRMLLGKLNRFVSTIPVFIIINLILCPVFINVSGTFPVVEYIKRILPVNYGIRGLHSATSRVIMILIGSISLLVHLSYKNRLPKLMRSKH